MAIQVYCQKCFTSNSLDAKECSKCRASFGRDKKYRVCVSVKGKRQTRVVDNLTIAREVESAFKGDLVRDEFNIAVHRVKKAVTLADVWDKFSPWSQAHKKSWKDDLYNYERHLKDRFGSKPLEDITSLDIERMKLELKKSIRATDVQRLKKAEESKVKGDGKGPKRKPPAPGKFISAQTIKHQLALLRRLFNVAVKWQMFNGPNPVSAVSMPRIDNRKTEYLTEDELKRLHETLDAWPFRNSAAFVKFALFTGCRRGELFRLAWADVDFERGLVTLRAPKGGKTTVIPICQAALDAIKDLDVTSEFVFPGKNGAQRTDFKGPWDRIRKAAGLPEDFRLHGLRHAFASTLVSSGVDLGIVRELLTHKNIGTTERYAHFAPDAVKQAAVKAGELLTGAGKKDNVIELKK